MARHGEDAWGIVGDPRIVRGADGSTWRVFEFISPFYDPPRRVLLFDRDGSDTIHRVNDYPRDWQFLSDAELLALIPP
jgi:hypothetical protein